MNSFELAIDEQSLVGSTYMARVANEIRRAASIEKASRKITQQTIAETIGTSRAVVNREMSGLENLSARRTAELLWALGWEPYFEARKISREQNQFHSQPTASVSPSPIKSTSSVSTSAKDTSLPFQPMGQIISTVRAT